MKLHRTTAIALTAALLALPAAAQVDDWRKIKYPRLPDFKIDKPEVFELENGMTVFLLEDRELPLISTSVRIRTGSFHEPAEKTGLAQLMAEVQRTGGTGRMTGDEVDEFLAARAASVETGMGGDSGFASMDCLADDFDEVFAVLADVLRTPRFDEDRLEVAKVQLRDAIARRNDDINGILFREFSRIVYGPDSPLSRLEEYATVEAVSREDLVAFHEKHYHPNNVLLGIVGDFDSKAIKEKVEAVFGDWSRGPDFDAPEVAYDDSVQPGVYFIEKTDVTQANIALGHLGIRRDNPDYFAVEVMNEVLGGSFASRLFSNVRSKKGLAYNVGGGVFASFTHPGVFRLHLQTKSETMAEGVEALKEEISKLIRDEPPTDAELKRAKESILNSFIFNYDSKEEILGQQMAYAYYGLPSDFLERYRANIEKVTRQDVIRVAKEHIHPDRLTLLVVGKPNDFDRPLSSFGEVTELDITIPPPPAQAAKVARTEETLKRGAEIMSTVVTALGGSEPRAVRGIRASGQAVVNVGGGQSMSMGRSVLLVFPDKLRQVLQTPMGEQTVVFDGERGFVIFGGQSRDLPAAQTGEFRKELARLPLFLARHHDDPELDTVAAGEDEVEGTTCQEVAVTFRGTESRLCVALDGRVLRQSYQGKHPMSQTPGHVNVYYSDYRPTDGRQVPYRQVIEFEGEEVMTLTIESFEFNPEVDPAKFERPAA